MYYTYLREDNESINLVNNSGVLSIIEDLSISEENIFTDKEADRVQLRKLLELIGEDDYIIIRSVVDLADEAKELLSVLKLLQDKQVVLVSIIEQYLNVIWRKREDRVLMKQRKPERLVDQDKQKVLKRQSGFIIQRLFPYQR